MAPLYFYCDVKPNVQCLHGRKKFFIITFLTDGRLVLLYISVAILKTESVATRDVTTCSLECQCLYVMLMQLNDRDCNYNYCGFFI